MTAIGTKKRISVKKMNDSIYTDRVCESNTRFRYIKKAVSDWSRLEQVERKEKKLTLNKSNPLSLQLVLELGLSREVYKQLEFDKHPDRYKDCIERIVFMNYETITRSK